MPIFHTISSIDDLFLVKPQKNNLVVRIRELLARRGATCKGTRKRKRKKKVRRRRHTRRGRKRTKRKRKRQRKA